MADFIMSHEAPIRLGFFLGILVLMALWELAAPRRALTVSKALRWGNNLALVVCNSLVLRLVFPVAALGVAVRAEASGWGLLHSLPLPGWLAVLLAVLLLDLLIYGQHVLMHKVPVLWRLHRMHHADLDFDVTTGARFHPLEIVLSMAIKMGAVLALGAPPLGVLIFEVLLNVTSMFNHGNVRIPQGADRLLRLLLVTPDMHRVHHSLVRAETDSNYGFNLPWWDRLFGTYRPQPAAGHEGMTIGIAQFREPRELWLPRLLTQPFMNPAQAGAPDTDREG
ncbi:MAG: sterol desaturase family protein [SAR324 cluster bacterium]|nr:sterol desaturase family protein [SAR324 cluster bacterium]MCZ6647239.1 sterol desaturase family protein [SAR324 cluster bacterium]